MADSQEGTAAEETVVADAEEQVPLDPGVIATKLQFLFETVRRPDGKRYTYQQVLDGIAANGGPSLSTVCASAPATRPSHRHGCECERRSIKPSR